MHSIPVHLLYIYVLDQEFDSWKLTCGYAAFESSSTANRRQRK